MHETVIPTERNPNAPDYQIIGEKVEKISDQDAVKVGEVKPLLIICDGIGSLLQSGLLANWLVEEVSALFENEIMIPGKDHIILERIQQKLIILNSSAEKKITQEVWSASTTLLVTFLSKSQDGIPTRWYTVGVGNGWNMILRQDGKVVDLSPGQVEEGATNGFPYNSQKHNSQKPIIRSVEYMPGDRVFVASDGLDLLVEHLKKLSHHYWQEFLLFLVMNAITKKSVVESFAAGKVVALWAEFAKNHKPPIDGKLEQYYGAGDDLTLAVAAPLQ